MTEPMQPRPAGGKASPETRTYASKHAHRPSKAVNISIAPSYGQRDAKRHRVLGNQIAHAPAKPFGQFGGVRCSNDRMTGMSRDIPRWEKHGRIGRFRRTWRHQNHEPRHLAPLDSLQSV